MIINNFDLILSPNPLLLENLESYDFNEDLDPFDIEETMIHLMKNHNGVGISANQVSYNKRVIAVRLKNLEPFAMFNPVILNISEDLSLDNEGCLSFPNLFLKINRPKTIEVKFLTSMQEERILKLVDYDARCVLHEVDHINGTCFVTYASKLKLDLAIRKMRKYNGRTK